SREPARTRRAQSPPLSSLWVVIARKSPVAFDAIPARKIPTMSLPSADSPSIAVVIPALNEEASLPMVLRDLPPHPVRDVIVVDNGSRDRTAEVARHAGARVVAEPERGYGSACLRGLAELAARPEGPPDIVVFLDADYSDHPDELPRLLRPILDGDCDF